MGAAWRAIGWMGLGAGLMYWADPRSGRRRRALAQDKAVHAVHEAESAAGVVARDVGHRTRGLFFKSLGRVRPEEVDVVTLEARVRSALGRACSHPHAIRVSVHQGRVRLEGTLLQAEHAQVLSRVRRVRGVHDVEDRLETQARPGSHPAPQSIQQNWSPTARFFAGLGGASLLTWGLSRRDLPGTTASVLGALLTLRGLTNLGVERLFGVGGGRRAIELHKNLQVHAPVEEVFGFWRAMENFPRFMSHVEEVRTTDGDSSHWRVKGPAGLVFEWDAVITRLIPNRVLAWKSVENSTVKHAGIIHFEPGPDGRSTRLDIRLSYNPPAGALGHAFARLLGADPRSQMDDDLVRFKSLLETGKTTGHETVSRDELSPESRRLH